MAELTRRIMLLSAMGVTMAAGQETLAWDFGFPSIDDQGRLDFAQFKGRVLLVVNTASFCGYTYQYEGLENLQKAASPRGLTVIGVPSQDFNQESADNKTVKDFCEGLDGLSLSRTRRTEEQEDSDRPALGSQTGLVHLDIRYYYTGRRRLADDLLR